MTNQRKPHSGKKRFERKSGNTNRNKRKSVRIKNYLSKEKELFKKHKGDLGTDYLLNDIFEIAYPRIATSIEIITSGKPDDILRDLHILLLETIESGLNTKTSLASFLGVQENDFVLDELYPLLKEALLSISEDERYRVTTKGKLFVEEEKYIPVRSQEVFTFYVDGVSGKISTKKIKTTNCKNFVKPDQKVDFDFVQKNWMDINKRYSGHHENKKEIVDLVNYKRSFIGSPKVQYHKVYALVYHPKDQSGKKIRIRAYSEEGKLLKDEGQSLDFEFSKNKYLFDFNQELALTEPFKEEFTQVSDQIVSDKRLAGKYLDISTFEHKQLIKDALLTAKFAVYIESPWIRRATLSYLKEMKVFLKKKDTKLFLAYGIDNRSQNKAHLETFQELEKLQKLYPKKVFLWHLPTLFETKFPNRNGTHRKILIKDYDFYVKGSYNWLSYLGDESQSYAVEEGTQFFDNVKQFWGKVFSEYRLDSNLLKKP